MKKLLALVAALMTSVIGVALCDQTIPFPYWQHGAGVTTFWSVTNYGCTAPVNVTIHLLRVDGTEAVAINSTLTDGQCWQPDTASWGGGWYTVGDLAGFGLYEIVADLDCAYLWSAVYGLLWTGSGQTGFTVVMPQNPYGVP